MKKTICIALLLVLVSSAVCGQKIQYGGMQQFAMIFGSNNVGIGFNFVNGVRFDRFFAGIGADIRFSRNDYYGGYYSNAVAWNTTSIFADGRYYINKKKNFFAKLNGGLNFIAQNLPDSDWAKYREDEGYYGAVGIGFKARLGNEVFYSFDVSYTTRQTKYNYSYRNFLSEWQTDKYDLRQNRIVLNLGIEIF